MYRHRKPWKQFLSMLLALAVFVTSVPAVRTEAANPLPGIGLEAYDYSRMESIMMDGKIMANRNNTSGEMQADGILPMSFGEMAYLQFALPYNTYYTMKVLDEGGADLGYLYAKFYTEHADGSVDGGYTSRGKSMDAIKLELKNFVYEMPYAPATNFFGIGLTGEVLPYRTLAEYYDFYDMDPPAKADLTEKPAEEPLPEELPDTEGKPEDGTPAEDETPQETPDDGEDAPDPDTPGEDGEDPGNETPAEDGGVPEKDPSEDNGNTPEEDASGSGEQTPSEETPETGTPDESKDTQPEEGAAAEPAEASEAGTPAAALIGACRHAAEFLKKLAAPMQVYAAEADAAAEPETGEEEDAKADTEADADPDRKSVV